MENEGKKRYRVIAALLQYPQPAWLAIMPEVKAYSRRLPACRTRQALDGFLDYLASQPLLRLQENYTAAFDLNPSTTLNMSYHLWGDGRKRAALLASLQQIYRSAGYDGPAEELPDFLPAMIEYLAVCRNGQFPAPFRQCLSALDGLAHRLQDAAPAYAQLLQVLAADFRPRQTEAGPPAIADPAPRETPGESGPQHRRTMP